MLSEEAGGLRLVRLRLALALVAAAVLPVAIIAPVLRIVTDDTREVEHARLAATVTESAAAISADLDGTTKRIVALAGGPGRRVLAGDADSRAETVRYADRPDCRR